MITRENYDEFFMMYADGELSPADKQAVDRFVMENADLAEELALYHQVQLPADDLSFTGKNSLYRFEAGDITATNHEEQFLLYVDNELDPISRKKVEVFVLQNPAYQETFTVLKQTKLPAEPIVFTDKASLYRKEERTPVAFMRWTRIAAAAALIGLAVLTWILLPTDKQSEQSLAKADGNHNNVAKQNSSTTNNAAANTDAVVAEKNASVTAGNIRVTKPGVQQEVTVTAIAQPVQENVTAYNPITVPVENKEATVAGGNPGIATNEVAISAERSAARAAAQHAEVKNELAHPDEEIQTAAVHQAVYKELDTDDEKKSLYLGSIEINKDKLRGFFRKAGSIFRGKAKQEEDSRTETTTPAGIRTLK